MVLSRRDPRCSEDPVVYWREPLRRRWVGGENALVGFRQGVEATVPALRRYARALTRNAELADDLVQDTLVRALRSEHLFHGGDIRSWLYTILTNLNRNRLRSLARRPPMQAIEDNDAPDMTGPEAGTRGTPAGRAGRPYLPGGRRGAGGADRDRDVAARARPNADQSLSRRRASHAAPRQVSQGRSR